MARTAYRDPHNIQQGKKNVNTENSKVLNEIFTLLIPLIGEFQKMRLNQAFFDFA
jgi:hypothetical protein